MRGTFEVITSLTDTFVMLILRESLPLPVPICKYPVVVDVIVKYLVYVPLALINSILLIAVAAPFALTANKTLKSSPLFFV